MSSPSLSFVAGLAVCYFMARVLDQRGKGGLFLIVLGLVIHHGEQAIVPGLLVMLPIGGLLVMFESARGGGGK